MAHRLEQNRARYEAQVLRTPAQEGIVAAADIRPATAASPPTGQYIRRTMSEVLTQFLEGRELDYGDRRADSDIEPVVRFLIELLGDPVMLDFNGDHLHKVKSALPRSLFPLEMGAGERLDPGKKTERSLN